MIGEVSIQSIYHNTKKMTVDGIFMPLPLLIRVGGWGGDASLISQNPLEEACGCHVASEWNLRLKNRPF